MDGLEIKDIDVLILCGGLGSRLRPVLNGQPKAMARIGNRFFLDILIDYTAAFGFRRFILCIGYLGDLLKQYYQSRKLPFEVVFSEEKALLGTAGALKNARGCIRSSHFLVINGDSICRVDLKDFLGFHICKNALISIVLTAISRDGKEYGVVRLGDFDRISGFNEKPLKAKGNLVSAGIYLFQKEALGLIPLNKEYSLEKDLFPKVINKNFYGYITKEEVVDIGTPQRYRKAKERLSI